MTTSGVYTFDPSLSDVVKLAYARIGIRGPAITTEHLRDAAMESNFLLAEFSNLQPLLFKSQLISQVLTAGTATYTLPARVVMILIAYVRTSQGTTDTDRVLGPLSTVEYASIPNKGSESPPTSFWLNRQITPEVTFWPTPDDSQTYTVYMQCVTQVQDASIPGGTTLDVPYRYLDAYVAGLASRLARIHAPQTLQEARLEAQRTWDIAATQDTEAVPVYIMPQIGTYRG